MFSTITQLIDSTGAFGVAVVMFLENVFPPIPSELVMPLAGYLAAQGEMSLVAVFLLGTLGAVAGAYLWYWVGAAIGKRRLYEFIDRHGIWLTLDRDEIERAIAWFDRHDAAAVFFGRMVPGIRTFISVPAGIAGMHRGKFLAYTVAGTMIWNGLLIGAGYILSANYDRVADWLDPITTAIVVGIVALYLYRVTRQLIRRRKDA